MRVALSIADSSLILEKLLDGGHSVVAGRLAVAFKNIGRNDVSKEIVDVMTMVGYRVKEKDCFEKTSSATFPKIEKSPYVNRLKFMWQEMRQDVLDVFPEVPGIPENKDLYLKELDDIYVADAYHSLSIEG